MRSARNPRRGGHGGGRFAACSASLFTLLLLSSLAGCLWAGVPETLTPYDFQTDPDGDDTLAAARSVRWLGDTATIAGGISIDPSSSAMLQSFLSGQMVGNHRPPPGEMDIFSLGSLDAGDEISLAASSLMGSLINLTPLGQTTALEQGVESTFVTLVNAGGEIVGYPAAAPVVIVAPGEYFLVISAQETSLFFDYAATITRRRHQPPATPHRGVLLLQFDGAQGLDETFFSDEAGAGGQGVLHVTELPPFDLAEARPDFPDQSERFKQTVRQLVEYIYADYDVLVTLDKAEAETAEHYDVLVFTSASPADLGFSEDPAGIEPLTDVEDRGGQVGIIFIQGNNDYWGPTDFNTYCATWASTAGHEYGHAVGLFHVAPDSANLMTPGYGAPYGRYLSILKPAHQLQPRMLIQNPDLYLARVLGRRDPGEAAAIRERTSVMMPGLANIEEGSR